MFDLAIISFYTGDTTTTTTSSALSESESDLSTGRPSVTTIRTHTTEPTYSELTNSSFTNHHGHTDQGLSVELANTLLPLIARNY